MSLNQIKYELLLLLRNKQRFIWAFLFPFALLTLYSLALGNFIKADSIELSPKKVLVLEEDPELSFAEFLKEAGAQKGNWKEKEESFQTASSSPSSTLSFLHFASIDNKQNWKKALLDHKVDAVFLVGKSVRIKISSNSPLSREVFRSIADSYQSMQELKDEGLAWIKGHPQQAKALSSEKMAKLEADLRASLKEGYVTTENRQKSIPPNRIFQFAILAYLAFYPLHSGLYMVSQLEADQSLVAYRVQLSPLNKRKRFLFLFAFTWLVQEGINVLTYLYALFLGLHFGPHHGWILLLTSLTMTASLLFGALMGTLLSRKPVLSDALAVIIPLFFSFIAGMMLPGVHPAIMKHAPWLHNFNPLGMASNGLYALYAEGAGAFYGKQILGLGILTFLFLVLTLLFTRRQSYESI